MAIEIAGAIVSKFTELMVDPVRQQICYVFKYKNNIETLKKQVEELKTQRERVNHSVEEATRQGEEIEQDVHNWLTSVDEFNHGAEQFIIKEEEKGKKRCFKGLCPNLITRYQLSKKAMKTANGGVDLLGKGKFDKVSYRTVPQRTSSMYVRGYQDFGSRISNLKKILETLADPNFNMIGVYGMGGVGKTTLVKKVVAQVKEDKLFDVVVMVEVTQSPNLEKIQEEIADYLGLQFREKSVSGRAARLCERLKKEKSILLVLDNIWRKLDLDAIGIPFVDDENRIFIQEDGREGKSDDQKRLKILLTSRNLDVLRSEMKTRKNFLVGPLSDEEAMTLFGKIVGDWAEKSDFQHTAVEIVEKCAGLPIAISTLANALKDKNILIWKDALQQLRKSRPRRIQDMDENVFSPIELSYRYMRNEEARSLFLLCSLESAGSDICISDLLKYCMGWGLLQGVDTVESGRNRVHTLINDLKASCLLLDGSKHSYVKMHDIIHAVAVSLASTDKLMFNLHDVIEFHKDSTAVSLPYRDIVELPERSECPNLKLFLLFMKTDSSLQIPDLFFEGMKEIHVLDLTGIHMSILPSSLCCLTSLQTLCLDGCQLRDIARIGELKTLEILSFLDSDIEQLPREIGQLTRLKLLDLSNCSKLEVIPPGVISSLSRLEELYMGNSFVQWEAEGLENKGQSNASLAELRRLSNLTTLEIHVLDARIMPQGLLFEKLERYRIFIGDEWNWSDNYNTSRVLKLKVNNTFYLGPGIKNLLKKSEDLYLDEVNGIKNVLYELDWEGFSRLKHLNVQNGSEFIHIVNSSESVPFKAFPILESLVLDNLINLEKICFGQLAAESFKALRIIKVEKCHRLRHLFPFSMVKSLSQLEEIKVTDCKSLKEIVGKESEDRVQETENISKMEFTKLHFLTIQCLPQLTSIIGFDVRASLSSETYLPTTMGSYEIIAEDDIEGSRSLFSQNIMFPSLEKLIVSSLDIKIIWLNQPFGMSSFSQTLTSLTVEECGGLKYIFSSSMVKSLVQLQKLEICNCKSMTMIIDTEVGGEVMVFPKLTYLKLKGLPELTRFGTGNSVEFPCLSILEIYSCPYLKTFFSGSTCADITMTLENCNADVLPLFDEKVAFPCLERMTLSHLDNLQLMWHNQLHGDSFCRLKTMSVECCDKIVTVVSSNNLERLLRLENLRIDDCGSLEEVFDLRGLNVDIAAVHLKTLVVRWLPKLRLVWNKDPQRLLSYPNLKFLGVYDCPSIKNLFPVSIARNLMQLETLEIKFCGLEEIVAEEGVETPIRFVFPQLTVLRLWSVEELKSFYPGQHSVEWPVLKRFQVLHCHKIKILASDFLSFQEAHGESRSELPIQQVLFSFEKIIHSLEKLSLNSDGITLLWKHHFPAEIFCKITTLEVVCFHDQSAILPFDFLHRFYSMETLTIQNCNFKELFPCEGAIDEENDGGRIVPIKKLKLHYLPNLRHIWKQDSEVDPFLQNLGTLKVWQCDSLINLAPPSISFQSLMTLDILMCHGLVNLIACSTAKSLVQLVKMRIRECDLVTEIIANEVVDRAAGEEKIIFRQLKTLELDRLPSLSCFCSANYAFKFQCLEQVIVRQCPKLETFSRGILRTPRLQTVQLKEGKDEECWKGDLNSTIQQLFTNMDKFRGIEHLELSEFPKLQEIWHSRQLPVSFFCNLKKLVANKCDFISSVISTNLLPLKNLEKLDVRNCDLLEQVFDVEGLNGNVHFGLLSRLREFKLTGLPRLRHIWMKNHRDILGFKRLTKLEVDGCDNLKFVFSSSMIKSLVQLKELYVTNCKSMEEVVITEEEEEAMITSTTLFHVLDWLRLTDLPKLKRFCSNLTVDGTIELCSLSNLWIENCPSMETFISNAEINSEPMENIQILQPLFDEKVRLPSLKTLIIDRMDNLRKIWDEQLTLGSLDVLDVRQCNKLLNVFPSNMIGTLHRLRELTVEECDSIEEIIEHGTGALIGGETHANAITDGATQLRELYLYKLPKLKHVWDWDDALGILTFQNLFIVSIQCCDSLRNIFPATIARGLLQLEKLTIVGCSMVEEIVAKEEVEVETIFPFPRFVFPKVTVLHLEKLPRLKSFYPGQHISEWRVIKKLCVWECDIMEIFFVSEFLSLQETDEQSQYEIPIIQQSVFLVDKVALSNMEELILDCNDSMKEIWNGKFSDSFCKLKLLRLKCFSEPATFLSCFLYTLPKLEELVVRDSSLKEIFSCEGLDCDEKALSKLRELYLHNLPQLLHLWNDNSQPTKVFQNLEILKASECGSLKVLVPSSVSFQNLTTLEVSKCDGLINLVTISTAKSLVQLTRLNIADCKMMEEIITRVGDEEEDEIVFSKLKYLGLHCLPSLTSCCSANCTFEFPVLEQVIVRQCPKMKIFSQGVISTPKLKSLQLTEEEEGEGCWKGDLNTTIKELNVQGFEEED